MSQRSFGCVDRKGSQHNFIPALYECSWAVYHVAMTKRARIAAVLAAPAVGALAFIGLSAAPAGAASPPPVAITAHAITITIPPIVWISISI